MTVRELPPDEWHRLEDTETGALWSSLNRENTRPIVVEEDGRIVGAWLMLRVVHAEGLWIAPEHRGSFGVAKRLLRGMRDIATEWGVDRVVTASGSAHVTELIQRFGGVPVPAESYVLPVLMKREERCPALS